MTTGGQMIFRRAVLGFDCETYNVAALDVAAHLARALRLDLFGIFVLDQMLDLIADYPGAREFVTSGRHWRAVDRAQLREQELELALGLRRIFDAKAAAEKLAGTFEVASGRVSDILAGTTMRTDILVIAEPRNTIGLVTKTFPVILEMAIRSHASVLLVPRRAMQRRGPILAIAGSPNDPAIATAQAIAAASSENLAIVTPYAAANHSEAAPIDQRRPKDVFDQNPPASLIVGSRTGLFASREEILTALGRSRGTPLLLLEPEDPLPSGQSKVQA